MNDMLREDLLALVSNCTTVSRREFVAGSLAAGFALAVQTVAALPGSMPPTTRT